MKSVFSKIKRILSVCLMSVVVLFMMTSLRPASKNLFGGLKSGSAVCEVNIYIKMYDGYEFNFQNDFRECAGFCYMGYQGDYFEISTITDGYRLDYVNSENYYGYLGEDDVESKLMIRIIQ